VDSRNRRRRCQVAGARLHGAKSG